MKQGISVSSSKVRVVIADDDHRVRAALRAVIEATPTLQLVGEAFDAPSASTVCASTRPDVAVLDVSMPGGGGAAAAAGISQSSPGTIMLAWSARSDEQARRMMTEAGVAQYLVKGAPVRELLDAIGALAGTPAR